MAHWRTLPDGTGYWTHHDECPCDMCYTPKGEPIKSKSEMKRIGVLRESLDPSHPNALRCGFCKKVVYKECRCPDSNF